MNFSHHSSNPLEARESDPTNNTYHTILGEIDQSQSSCDELDQLTYQQHVENITGKPPVNPQTPKAGTSRIRLKIHPPRPPVNPQTPKAGPSRIRLKLNPPKPRDSDVDMQSEDPLAEPYKEDIKVTPRKGRVNERNVYLTGLDIPPFKGKAGPPEAQDIVEEQEMDVPEQEEDQDFAAEEEAWVDENNEQNTDVDEEEEMAEDDDDNDNDDERYSSPLTPISFTDSSPYSSPQSSRPSSPDEATTLQNRPQEEQEEIEEEIRKLYDAVPDLEDDYQLIDRLGTGTFSSVYKAIDLNYSDWYNKTWLGHHPPESSAYYQSAGPGYKGRGGRAAGWRQLNGGMDVDSNSNEEDENVPNNVFVAIKRIYTTSGPERIRNELAIMEECRSCRHTSQIMTAFRHQDQVVIVLPYQRNKDFREFYQDLHPEGVKCYFRCLFRALRDIHARGIIHRDVKPANFLYDPFTGVGTLCDFGLASRMEEGGQYGKCFHTPATKQDPHGKNTTPDETGVALIKKAQKEARRKSLWAADRVGYPEQDRRPVSKANRAGTRGFRAPEVLLKCGAQTGAIDVWSAGVILLFFLTGKFPIFQSNDDIEGLMEIAVILGRKKIEKAATLHGRTFATNIPDLSPEGITWQEFVEKLNPDIQEPRKYDMRYYPHNCKHRDGRGAAIPPPPPPSSSWPILIGESDAASATMNPTSVDPAVQQQQQQNDRYANPMSVERHARETKLAFQFLEWVLHFESTKRATPRKALYHKFLEESGAPSDDEVVPRLPTEGVCQRYHGIHNGDHYANVYRKCLCRGRKDHGNFEAEDEIDLDSEDDEGGEEGGGECDYLYPETLTLEAGEGIPIGFQPCEFHRDSNLYQLASQS